MKMTVAELIRHLKRLPGDSTIVAALGEEWTDILDVSEGYTFEESVAHIDSVDDGSGIIDPEDLVGLKRVAVLWLEE